MNVAILTPTIRLGDGQGGVNFHLAMEALRRGFHVTLVAARIGEELRNHPNVTCAPINWSNLPTDLVKFQLFALHSAQWLRKHRRSVDLVHAHGFVTWETADLNTSHFVHGDWLRSPYRNLGLPYGIERAYQSTLTRLNVRWEKRAYRQAKKVVAVSGRVQRQLEGIGISRDKIDIILNGVDLQRFRPGRGDRQQFGLPEQVNLGLFVGDIRRSLKNLDTVLHALEILPDAHLAVVGDTTDSPYPALAEKLGISNRVHFLGYRRDVDEIMRAVDLFVFPSRSESCPLVLFEALASGLPAIIASTVGASELVTRDCGVVLDDPNDAKGVARAWTEITCSPEKLNCMAQAARASVEPYSWQRMGEAYIDLYQSMQ